MLEFNFQPKEYDGLPREICKECCRQLKKCYSFNIKCEESDSKLKQSLERPHIEITVFTEDCNKDGTCVSKDVHNAIKCEEHSAVGGIVKNQSADLIGCLLQTENKDTKEDIKLGKFMEVYIFKKEY